MPTKKNAYKNLNKAFDRWKPLAPFVTQMVKKLEENKKKKGGREGWINDEPASLAGRVMEETKELQEALTANDGGEKTLGEAADVANMAMMVADASGLLEEEPREKKERRKVYALFDRNGLRDAAMYRENVEPDAAAINANRATTALKVKVVECYEVNSGERIFTKNQLDRMKVLMTLIEDAEFFAEIGKHVKELQKIIRKGTGP